MVVTAQSSTPRRHRVRTGVGAAVVLAGVAASIAGLGRVPAFSLMPALLGLAAFSIGKYVFCPLRWRALSLSDLRPTWFVRAFAEAELLGLCTPGHAGADVWRVRRLQRIGRGKACAIGEVAADRLVGSMGILAFALLSGSTLPGPMLLGAGGLFVALVAVTLVVLRVRPALRAKVPTLPGPKRLAAAFGYSLGYQASVLVMLIGVVTAVGGSVHPLALAGVFAASQCAGVVPGPQGASPKDGALVVGLVALGVPWEAALGAVSLKAALAWVPGLLLGSSAFLMGWTTVRSAQRAALRSAREAAAALPHPPFGHPHVSAHITAHIPGISGHLEARELTAAALTPEPTPTFGAAAA